MSNPNEEREPTTLEEKHARGYGDMPQTADEIGEWEPEQVWNKYEPEGTQ